MAISKDDILSAIEEMSVMDLVELISAIEEKFGVTAAAAVAAAPAAAGGDAGEAAEEKDDFDVVLTALERLQSHHCISQLHRYLYYYAVVTLCNMQIDKSV